MSDCLSKLTHVFTITVANRVKDDMKAANTLHDKKIVMKEIENQLNDLDSCKGREVSDYDKAVILSCCKQYMGIS